MITALISQVKGMAAFDDGERVGFLDVRQPDTPYYADEHFAAARELSEASDLETATIADLSALRTHLILRKEREELLHAALILLDADRSESLREQAAKALSMHRDSGEWPWVEGVLMSAPLPESADALGATRWPHPHHEFFTELAQVQDKVKVLHTAWHALPSAAFVNETRDQTRARIVRHGVFRQLLRGSAPSSYSPFSTALASYAAILERIARSKSVPGNDAFKWWLEPSSDNPRASLLWEIAPWRSAWLAAEWPRLESTLACQAYAHFTSAPTSFKSLEKARTDSTVFVSFCNDWNLVRHHSSISTSVDLIWKLAFAGHEIGQAGSSVPHLGFNVKSFQELELDQKATSAELRRGLSKNWHSMAEEDERRLQKLVLAFFDARQSGEAGSPSGDAPNYVASATTRWKVLAQSAHLALLRTGPLYSSSTIDPWAKRKSLSKLSHIENWLETLRKVIAIYALDRVFQQNGCLVHVWPKTYAITKTSQQRQAVFWNLSSRRRCVFKGHLAWLVGCLQDRLVADLHSGLPREHCGWTGLTELDMALGQNEESVVQGIYNLRRLAANAGFASETIQQRADGIRLNPEVATNVILRPKKSRKGEIVKKVVRLDYSVIRSTHGRPRRPGSRRR